MRKIGFSIFAAALLVIGCQDFDYGLTPAKVDENVVNNANKVGSSPNCVGFVM